MEGKLELISRYDEYYLVKSISNEDISLGDILLHNESGRIISVNRFWESNGSKTIMDTGVRNPIELVISGNTFKKLIGYYSVYQKLPLSKLSLKNCQAIENGYDFDELAKVNYDCDPYIAEYLEHEFKKGFQKALEILGDKKFSEDDIKRAILKARIRDKDNPPHPLYSVQSIVQSLQQTEWDVEIEMEQDYLKWKQSDIEDIKDCLVPKLDADGCLILRRI